MAGMSDKSVLEFCAYKFNREHIAPTSGEPFYPEPKKDMRPLKSEPRKWGVKHFTGFTQFTEENVAGWVGRITANRSDGQFFYVDIVLPLGFSQNSSCDPVDRVWSKLILGIDKLNSFRDCSCGCIGYRKTGELDSDGDPIEQAVGSPCEIHDKKQAAGLRGKEQDEMTTLLDFQKYASENQREANFQTLCDMLGGASHVFIAYYGGSESYTSSMDRALQNFVLTEASGPLAAFILVGVHRRLESIDRLHNYPEINNPVDKGGQTK